MAWEKLSSAGPEADDKPDAQESASPSALDSGVRIRTVVVDDSDAMRKSLIALLQVLPVDIVGEARDADEALRVCVETQPDLIFLDIMMPGRTGLEILGEMKAVCPRSRVIMLTSMADREAVVRSAKLGAHDYLLKPFNKAVLCDRVRALCEEMLGKGGKT